MLPSHLSTPFNIENDKFVEIQENNRQEEGLSGFSVAARSYCPMVAGQLMFECPAILVPYQDVFGL